MGHPNECSCICLSFPFSFTNICESGAEFYWACVAHTELICAAPSLFWAPSLHYRPKNKNHSVSFVTFVTLSLALTDRAWGHCHLLMLNSCLHPLYQPPLAYHFEAFFPNVLCYPDPERHPDREVVTNNNNISHKNVHTMSILHVEIKLCLKVRIYLWKRWHKQLSSSDLCCFSIKYNRTCVIDLTDISTAGWTCWPLDWGGMWTNRNLDNAIQY